MAISATSGNSFTLHHFP